MIPNKGPEIVSTLSADDSNEFTVKVDERTFDLLFDGLYSNKIQSIIREVCSNAYDAHRAAGREDQPFDLIIPTYLEPTFTVRDYGTSMVDEDVRFMYTRVFDSSKQQSNDFTGCYGLGSKSPFAYTDSFTAIAYLKGEKRTYLVGRNERRVPQINLVNTEPTDEPDGFEVSFPVDENDVFKFQREASRVLEGYAHWITLPKLNFDYEPPEILLQDDNWQVRKGHTSMDSRVYFRQGTVLYPAPDTLHDLMRASYGARDYLVIDVPIGSLDTSASRESLGQTAATQERVQAEAEKVRKYIRDIIQSKIDAAANHSAAVRELNQYRDMFAHDILNPTAYSYKGRPLYEHIEFLLTSDVQVYNLNANWSNRGNATAQTIEDWIWSQTDRSYTPKQRRYQLDPKTQRRFMPNPKNPKTRIRINSDAIADGKFFILIDSGANVVRKNSRIAQYVAEHASYGRAPSGFLLVEPKPKDVRLLMENLEIPKERVIQVSSLDDVEQTSKVKTGRSAVYAMGPNRWQYELEPFKTRFQNDPSDDVQKVWWLPVKGKSGPVFFNDGKTVTKCGPMAARKQIDKATSQMTQLSKMVGYQGPTFPSAMELHFVTEHTAKKNPSLYTEDNRFDTVYLSTISENEDMVISARKAMAVKDEASGVDPKALVKLLDGDPIGLTEDDFLKAGYLGWRTAEELYGYPKAQVAAKEGAEAAKRCIGERYPLLSVISGRASSEDVSVYIDAMDCYNEKKELESQDEDSDDSTED